MKYILKKIKFPKTTLELVMMAGMILSWIILPILMALTGRMSMARIFKSSLKGGFY